MMEIIPIIFGVGLVALALSSRSPKKKPEPESGQSSGSAGATCPKEEWINASDLAAMMERGDPCTFSRPWFVYIRTFEELRYWGGFISGQMLFRAESERPGNTVDQAALDRIEKWINACKWTFANLEWLTLQDKIEAYEIALRYNKHMQGMMDEQMRSSIDEQSVANLKKLRDVEKIKFPPGSMPIYEHFKQVLTDYNEVNRPALFGGEGMVGGKAFGDGFTDTSYPHLTFGNYRWAAGLPNDRYEQAIYAFEPEQWCASTKEEIWRDPDANGWPGGWIRDPQGHPFYVRQCGTTKPPAWTAPSTLLNEILLPRLFAVAGKTLLFEYAACHFLQTVYLGTINTNTASENASAALNTAGKGLALAGGLAGALASTGVGTVGAAIVAAFGFIASIIQWALQLPANIEREKMARARAANLLRKNLARFGVSVDQFFGWKLRVNHPDTGTLNRAGGLVFKLNETNGELEAAGDTDAASDLYSIIHDPWYYFRVTYSRSGGMAQVPLLVLRPDFDFCSYTAYDVAYSKIYFLRVVQGYQEKAPRQQFELLNADTDLKNIKTPKAWGAK